MGLSIHLGWLAGRLEESFAVAGDWVLLFLVLRATEREAWTSVSTEYCFPGKVLREGRRSAFTTVHAVEYFLYSVGVQIISIWEQLPFSQQKGQKKDTLYGRGENAHKRRREWNNLTLVSLESWRRDLSFWFLQKVDAWREGAGSGCWDGGLKEWPLFFSPTCTYPFATVSFSYFVSELYFLWPVSLGEHQYGIPAFPLVPLLLPEEAHVWLDHWSQKDERHVEKGLPDLRIP